SRDSKAKTRTSVRMRPPHTTRMAFRGWTARKKPPCFQRVKHKRNEGDGRLANGGDSSFPVRVGLVHDDATYSSNLVDSRRACGRSASVRAHSRRGSSGG